MQAHPRLRRRFLRVTAWTVGILLLLLICLHIWFIRHAERALEELVVWKSQGKLKASVKRLHIDYFNNKASIKEITFYNTDTLRKGASYRFAAKELRFTILSKWALIFHKQLLLDTLIFTAPDITITNRGVIAKDTTKPQLPIVEQLGSVYKTINQALTVLNLKCFKITDGRVIVKDALDTTGKPPLLLSHIFFSIDKPADTTSKNNEGKPLSADVIILRLAGQVIKLSDKKSSIGFSELLIDSKQRLVQVLEPAIHLYPSAGKKNSFNSTIGRVAITGLDFNLLYTKSFIQIDSVYLKDTKDDLELFTKNAKKKVEREKDSSKKKISLEETLGKFPLAININHIAIINGNAAVHLNQGAKTTQFQTINDNLTLTDVRINDSLKNALTIKGFDYTIRNFGGYTPDSMYSYHFDSLQFLDNKIGLFNLILTTPKSKEGTIPVIRNHIIPRFEITGLDWQAFIFHNRLSAEKAVLYNPVFNVVKNDAVKKKSRLPAGKKKTIYQTLSVMDNLLDLNEMRIVNGQFNLKEGNHLDLHIKQLNWNINTNELTESKSFKDVAHAIKELSFDTATAVLPNMAVHVSTTNFINSGKNLLVKKMQLSTTDKSMEVDLAGVAVNDFLIDKGAISVNGIAWKEGNIHIAKHNKTGSTKPASKGTSAAGKSASFLLNNISANNTNLFFENKKLKATGFLQTFDIKSVSKQSGNPIELKGLSAAGKNIAVILQNGKVQCSEFVIKDEQPSSFKNILFEQKNSSHTIAVKIPSVTLIPFINKTLAGNAIVLNDVNIHEPDIIFASHKKTTSTTAKGLPMQLPTLHINGFLMDDAVLHFSSSNEPAHTVVDCKQITLRLQSIQSQTDKSFLINNVTVNSSNISFNKNDSTVIKSDGNLQIALGKLLFNTSTKNWQASLDKLLADKISYTRLQAGDRNTSLLINKINLQNAALTNTDLKEPLPWLINASTAVVALGYLHLQNSHTNLQATNFLFNASQKHIGIDSVSMDPGQTPEDFMAHLVTRKDYMAVSTGKMAIDGMSYQNKLFHIETISTSNAKLNIYSDKLINAGATVGDGIKPLITTTLKNIKTKVQVDKINLNNMEVVYAELNAKSKQPGRINFTNINGNILNVLSAPQPTADSLRINIYAKFLDTMQLHLMLNEAYNDPLDGFKMQLQLGHGDIRLMNAFLGPLVGVKIPAGYLDLMSLSSAANDKIATGSMQLYYHNLKAQILDAGGASHPKFKTKIINRLANTLVIRNNNDKRRANFTLYRDRQKSIINYFIKMIVQGSGGNVAPGVSKIIFKKQNKKLEAKDAVLK